ncbi:hypothetical protein ACX3VT_03545 [Aerococcus sanguinicola]|uniref:hypothetical protein n=1 Tax=unclassified Aerococcus TaxID=2618060 RepID=UPI0008A5659B|nr:MULTISPECIES: hypothetical protein [unclassified Aerococcus]MDK6232905.1 hypothetical protein [Aerococcus sp. UMB10185]MDK6805145.1 hypothetical protein [Aerococcus sp. UMB7834]MDK6855795.1 hypothetical protein [Aerococcus sp. UMB7533]MDK8502536.1 hypothetical protein [Aerococcus sp. UMB1112A]OFN03020.1 hypothetical protein HMPREF2626_00955 [Aerococcus sp. HMSC062A02]
MPAIQDILSQLFKEMKVPVEYRPLDGGQHLFALAYQLGEDKVVPCHIIARDFNEGEATTDFQINYRQLCQVEDYQQTAKALEVINDLNRERSGYYNLILSGDGEIYTRCLSRTGEDVRVLYELMTLGASVARDLYPRLEQAINNKTVKVAERSE